MDINEVVARPEYEFLKTNKNLGDNLIFLTYGGSYAYGTNVEGSDIDIRGITKDSIRNLLGFNKFEQFINEPTDTTIYAVTKMVHLLAQCNPNCIEILGCKPEHYIIYNEKATKLLMDNKKLFLSKRCVNTFGGYAISQLRRLENITNKYVSQKKQEEHILDSIENAKFTFKDNYFPMNDGELNLYIDKAVNEEYDSEIFMDINLKHYPLRDYSNMWNEMKSIVSSYNRIGKRNQRALDHKKIGKHSMHLVRLYFMCLDILRNEEIVTYREKEHDLLMDIRNGKYLDENEAPIPEFFDLVNSLENELKEATANSSLPDHPNMKELEDLLYTIIIE
jgi:predicted nucleotidyltransferase